MMEQDAEIRAGFRYCSEIAVGDKTMDELEETGGYMEIDNEGKGDKETTRESGKHRSKDRKKGRREEMDRGSKDRERGKERVKEDHKSKDSDKHVARGRNQLESNRERRKEDRSEPGKEKDRDKEGSSDKLREKERDPDRGKHRGKERGREKELDKEREQSHDQENEWGRDRGKDRGRDWEKEREAERERGPLREFERAKVRDKVHDHGRDRDKDHERDRDKGNDRSKIRERDHEKDMDKELGRERGKERGHERGKERERESEKDRGRAKDRGREKEKIKDREKEKEKEKDRDRDKLERERNRDTSRARDIERRETSRGKEEEQDERVKVDGEISRVVKKREGAQDEGVTHDRIGSKDHNEKAMGLQSTTELQDRLIKMKEERLKRKSDGDSEILSWISKSRVLEEKRNAEKEKAARLSKALEEQDNILAESEDDEATDLSAKDLAGVKILHGLDKVIEGGAVVLTLKDQNILADGDINEEVDMLENVEIGQQKQRDAAYKAAKKKTGMYDDKFGDDTGKTMLPQYDDPIEDEGVTLDEGGRFTGEAEKKLDELRRRLEGGSTSKSFEDLTSSGKISSDYFTPDEMLQFKKPRKKKSLRKKDKLDLDALEAEAISTGLGTGDLGSRNDLKRQSAKEEQEKTEAERRSNAYKSAYAKAEEASKALRQEQTSAKAVEDDNLVFGEDYDDLQRSLEQARKLALKRQDGEAVSVPQAVALLAVTNKEQVYTQSPTRGAPENKVVVTEMEEFVLGLQLNEEVPKLESEDVFKDVEVMSKPLEHETKTEESGWTEVQESNKDELPINEEKEDIAPDEIIHEVPVGKGLAGAFKLLKERGTLNEGIDWGGRNMDKKKSKLVGIHENDGPKEIHIERTDEFGRIMTPKEAFRVISHKFHGKGPGKMKQEKRMKQYQEDLKTKQMKASDTPSQSMERMREAQARLKTPYLVLSGHVKPGQTSDPRSGFATVEKDHLGSLTPMLGDKKVEHFLGIKRKPESGSMGPPPSKKFKS